MSTPISPEPGSGPDPAVPAGPWASDSVARPDAPPPTTVEQPSSIRTAVLLMFAGAALSAVGILLTLVQTDTIRDQIEENNTNLNENEIDTVVTFAIASTIVLGLVAVGLWLWMAYANGEGKSWARVVATVLGALNVVSTVLGMVQGITALSLAVSVLSIVLAVAILVLLYRPDSSRYYELRSG